MSSDEETIKFIETTEVVPGVRCDIYAYVDDSQKDLAVVTVNPGCKTPLQRVVSGIKTLEKFVSGKGILRIRTVSGEEKKYSYPGSQTEVEVEIGQLMQWEAIDMPLVFEEMCCPPYTEGRFENISN